jgi:hypothetical protein
VNKRAKVRAALIDLEGVADVLIDEKIVFQMRKGARLDRTALAEKLAALDLDAAGGGASVDGNCFGREGRGGRPLRSGVARAAGLLRAAIRRARSDSPSAERFTSSDLADSPHR